MPDTTQRTPEERIARTEKGLDASGRVVVCAGLVVLATLAVAVVLPDEAVLAWIFVGALVLFAAALVPFLVLSYQAGDAQLRRALRRQGSADAAAQRVAGRRARAARTRRER